MVEKAHFAVLSAVNGDPVHVRVDAVVAVVSRSVTQTTVHTSGGAFTVAGTVAEVELAIATSEGTPPALGELSGIDLLDAVSALRDMAGNNRLRFGASAARVLRVASWLEDVAGSLG